jgi:putative oxidoreductase
MERLLGRFTPQLFALLRIVAGLMFALHGSQKLVAWPGGKLPGSGPMVTAGGIIELVAGLLIAIGLLTGWAAFIASGEMAVAYFKYHAPGGFWPTVNQGELAVLYCFLFFYFAAHGAGVWSVDAALKKK